MCSVCWVFSGFGFALLVLPLTLADCCYSSINDDGLEVIVLHPTLPQLAVASILFPLFIFSMYLLQVCAVCFVTFYAAHN